MQLPPLERTTALIEAYFTNLSWVVGPIYRAQVIEDLLPLFYPKNPRLTESQNVVDAAIESPHDLALFLAVLAVGAVADFTQSAENSEAIRYNKLSRAALGLRSVFDVGSLSGCQTILLYGCFELHSGKRASQESAWKMFRFGMCLSTTVSVLFANQPAILIKH